MVSAAAVAALLTPLPPGRAPFKPNDTEVRCFLSEDGELPLN